MISKDELEEAYNSVIEPPADNGSDGNHEWKDDEFWKMAGAIKAILDADTAQLNALLPDHVVVPREPSEEAIGAGFNSWDFHAETYKEITACIGNIYQAMIKTAEQKER